MAGAVQEKVGQAGQAVSDTAVGAKDAVVGKGQEAQKEADKATPDKPVGDQTKDAGAPQRA